MPLDKSISSGNAELHHSPQDANNLRANQKHTEARSPLDMDFPEDRSAIYAYLNYLPQTVFETDENGTFRFMNRFGLTLFGYTPEDLDQETTLFDIIVPEEEQQLRKTIPNIFIDKPKDPHPYTARNKTGSRFPILIQTRPLFKNGCPAGLVGVLVNTTKYRAMEKRLQQQLNRMEGIVQAIPDIVFILDKDARYLDILSSHDDLLYQERATFLGKHMHEIVPKEIADLVLDATQKAIASGNGPVVEYKLNVLAGERWFEGHSVRLNNFEDAEDLVIFAVHDITARKQIEFALLETRDKLEQRVEERTQELREINQQLRCEMQERARTATSLAKSEARYRILFEAANDVIFQLDTEGCFQAISPVFETFVGEPPAKWIGRPFSDLLTPDSINAITPLLSQLMDQNKTAPTEIRYKSASGEIRFAEVLATPLIHDERVVSIVGMARDTTERKKTEEMLLHNERMAAVGTLSAGVAHEFNNIHTTVLGFLELALLDKTIKPETQQLLQRVLKATKRGAKVTNNLLAFAKPSAASRDTTDLNHVVEEILALVRSEFTSEGIELVFKPGKLPILPIDESQFGQVILNLLINARHAELEREDKTVKVSTGRKGNRVFVSVQDNGCGVPEEHRPYLFLPFFTTKGEHAPKQSPQTRVRGTGLGLSVSDTIVRSHNGIWQVESEEGVGTTITIWLPITETVSPSPKTTPKPPPTGKDLYGIRICVLDDEPDVQDLLNTLLSREGADVSITDDGYRALRDHRRNPYDLILVDLQMPKMNGDMFLQELYDLPAAKQPACMIVTGKKAAAELLQHKTIRCDVISKPFAINELLDRIHALLENRQTS